MKPDAIIKCVKDYSGKTSEGKTIILNNDTMYLKTTGDKYIYLNKYDEPTKQLPWLKPEEFNQLLGTYLEKAMDI